jgi:hypothetical protein
MRRDPTAESVVAGAAKHARVRQLEQTPAVHEGVAVIEGEVGARVSGMLRTIARAPVAVLGPMLLEDSSTERPVLGRVVGPVMVGALTRAAVLRAATTRRR